ncbi:MAG: NAD(+)/NADH kinase [Bacteroidota bacterium]
MKLAIFGRYTNNTDLKVLRSFFQFLTDSSIPYTLFQPYVKDLILKMEDPEELLGVAPFNSLEEILDCTYMYCFGGDGTVLEAVRLVQDSGIPIFGVNFGRLGYLTSITQHDLIPATKKILEKLYYFDCRNLLTVVSDPPGIFSPNNTGINDLTIHKSKSNEMITINAYINGEFLNTYRGDGLIVATPTGSTAYSLSCGGPIIFPNSSTLVLTPVAPHSLTVRPVVIPDNWVISLQIESRSGEAMISLDTRTELVKTFTSLAIRCSDFHVKFLKVYSNKHIDNLRKSLMWGSDNRNWKQG